jgi:CubicO group peptidase (beta-lactamase class C family)
MGDLLTDEPLPAGVNAAALQAASDWAFTRESPEQVTLSLLVVHRGRIIHERYAPGVDMATRTRTWSTAKSIAATLIGMLVDQGRWRSTSRSGSTGCRARRTGRIRARAITLRHVLHMSSGLETVDNGGLEYATGLGHGVLGRRQLGAGALNRG